MSNLADKIVDKILKKKEYADKEDNKYEKLERYYEND
jgi:hypothetical protein